MASVSTGLSRNSWPTLLIGSVSGRTCTVRPLILFSPDFPFESNRRQENTSSAWPMLSLLRDDAVPFWVDSTETARAFPQALRARSKSITSSTIPAVPLSRRAVDGATRREDGPFLECAHGSILVDRPHDCDSRSSRRRRCLEGDDHRLRRAQSAQASAASLPPRN